LQIRIILGKAIVATISVAGFVNDGYFSQGISPGRDRTALTVKSFMSPHIV
jgi:hypothetical protein